MGVVVVKRYFLRMDCDDCKLRSIQSVSAEKWGAFYAKTVTLGWYHKQVASYPSRTVVFCPKCNEKRMKAWEIVKQRRLTNPKRRDHSAELH